MTTRTQEANDGPQFEAITRVIDKVRTSASMVLLVFGASLILLGYLIQNGVWAAIFPIWGAAAVLFGLAGYTYVWWTHRAN